MYESTLVWIGRIVIVLQLVNGALGWGKEGHYAICKIAEGYLTEDASARVKELLPEHAEGDLAAVCSWADEVRFHYHWSSALHYVDTPDFMCNYKYCRDCHDFAGRKDRCVTGAIFNYTNQLSSAYEKSRLLSDYNLTEALMFLSHFVGDVHQEGFVIINTIAEVNYHQLCSEWRQQPLHVGFVGDEGGNTIIVRWYRRKTNLHHVWDTMIIDSALKTFYDKDLSKMIQSIQKNLTENWANQLPLWEYCAENKTVCPNQYASESISFACKFAYKNATPGSTLEDDYFLSRLPVVEKRLAQSGIRLAAILNRIFTSPKKIIQATSIFPVDDTKFSSSHQSFSG